MASRGDVGEDFRRGGVEFCSQALGPEEMHLVAAAFEWKLANPGPQLQHLYPERGVTFLNARGQSQDAASIVKVLTETKIPAIVAALFGSGPVWFHGEQIFLKDARDKTESARRTPWHQDAAYDPFMGSKIAVVWITLDPVAADCALEIVRGSHRGPLYNGSTFAGEDETAGFFLDTDRPRLPDIQGDRSQWDIVSWPANPGDLVIFHSQSPHGGGATGPGTRRRSLTLRFVGDDVVRTAVPELRLAAAGLEPVRFKQAIDSIALGQPYYLAGIRQVHPGVDQVEERA